MNSSSVLRLSEVPIASSKRIFHHHKTSFTRHPPLTVISESDECRKLILLGRSLIRIPEIRAAWSIVRKFCYSPYQQCIDYNNRCGEVINDLSQIHIIPEGGFRVSIKDFKFSKEGLTILTDPITSFKDKNPEKKKIIAVAGALYLSNSKSLYEKVYINPLHSEHKSYNKNDSYKFVLPFNEDVRSIIKNIGVKKAKIFFWVKSARQNGFEHSTEIVFTSEDYEG